MNAEIPLERIDAYRWRIPQNYQPGMRVPGMVYASEAMIGHIRKDACLEQVAHVAHLPGIVRYSLAMPDIHWGYGFPIGGVAATDPKEGGVVSPGGVGYDINCGVRLIRTELRAAEIRSRIKALVVELFKKIPCGVGESGEVHLSKKDLRKVAVEGSHWAIAQGFGRAQDLECTEARGALEDADPEAVSARAYERGRDQLGTLGSGNHFLEIQEIDEIYDEAVAARMGLGLGQVTVMIHSGSRGFGYQVCEDSLETARHALDKYKIRVPDIQLACAPVHSPEGQHYLGAMRAAANYAWANRQCLMHLVLEVFEGFFHQSAGELGFELIYDVAHNIAKMERFPVKGQMRTLCVHRKGATRAFPPGNEELPEVYRVIGQPVIVPGDMGRYSFLLVGAARAMEDTFGTACHGAGRALSRRAALKAARGRDVLRELEQDGIMVMARSRESVAEEQPAAYKDVRDVVSVIHEAGIARKVLRMRPLGVIKG
ncbi:MAG: RtcB family protein [Candidatus Omnitrophota bacterium]